MLLLRRPPGQRLPGGRRRGPPTAARQQEPRPRRRPAGREGTGETHSSQRFASRQVAARPLSTSEDTEARRVADPPAPSAPREVAPTHPIRLGARRVDAAPWRYQASLCVRGQLSALGWQGVLTVALSKGKVEEMIALEEKEQRLRRVLRGLAGGPRGLAA